ncbi:Crp/Fnr family transcriptional regulator [uncultured Alistipes sp.]|uniref:Crp/Fnr family transcriptional regulator n=1 Tax=uncultured Alistipes sp. TaxID=538949 RepID=UPI0028042022|nr:Crp/Fnr family transcriptional regulator [uncultured Alistipes sp.]
MTSFLEKFSHKYNLPQAACERLLGRMARLSFRKGDCVVRQGERNADLYLVSRGIWLGHYLHNGADISLWFAGEGEAIFSTRSYVADRPSQITIEAMCDAELYAISRADLEDFFGGSVEAANFGRRLFEEQFLDLENWLLAGGAPRAEERYRTLLEENPELLRIVPLKHIASYLWITPQSLSRIRARINRKKP